MDCPICGSKMIKRKRKYDKKEFWGCTRFPKCKGIVNMSFKPVSDKPNLPTPDSRFQQPILDTFLTKGGNVIVKACAGSGKTTLLKMLSYELPKNVTIAYIVFNAKIRDEAVEVLPAWVSPMTSHQLGFSAVRNYNSGKTEVDGNKVQDIVKTLVRPKWDVEKWMISPVCDLVSKLKNTLAGQSNDALEALADKYGIDLNDSKERVFELVRLAMVENDRNTAVIDFDDMLYFPIKFNLAVQKYDIMLTDECFPYKTPILMKNKVNLPIGKIVEEKIEGEVLTYNTENGTQEYKKITGWHKIPNSKPLVKVLAVQFPNCNGGHRATVTCTSDHRIFTKEDGWVEAEKLKPMYHHIQRETLAETSQAYKISNKGRKVLSETITKNNKLGKTGNSPKRFSMVLEEKNRGGNGKGLTEPQKIYLERLGSDWEAEYSVVPTREQRLKYKSATHYKIDVANPELKIAIELDKSLTKAAKIYKKKDKILEELGWKVYHLENNFAVRNIDSIIKEIYDNDCPVWCQVTSVQETQVKEFYVYDITVEDNHNFYANGVLVHNCQDFNAAQLELLKLASNENTQVIGVGDEDQCQPSGTKVVVSENVFQNELRNGRKNLFTKNIEDVQVGDMVLSRYRGGGHTFVKGQLVEGVAKRQYEGLLYDVKCDGKVTSATPNHKWLVKWNESIKDKYCVYLMQKGDWFRIGCHRLFANDTSNTILQRLRQERGDSIWILDIFESKKEALIQELITSITFGIPTTIFYANDSNTIKDEDFITKVFEGIPNFYERAIRCLHSFDKLIEYPFSRINNRRKQGFNCTFLVHSSNLFSGYMDIPSVNLDSINDYRIDSYWKDIEVNTRKYRGFVHSLKVKNTETYVANGLVTHNSLYSFRGADLDAMEKMKTFFDAESLPLSITYRVPKSGVQLVNDLFPHIPFEAAKNASEGKISTSSNSEMLLEVRQGDLVLSRTNAPLIKPVFDLLKMGIKATIVGRDIGKNLINTLNRFNKSGRDLTKVLRALESYRNEEVTKLLRLNKGMQASNLTDTVSTIFALADGAKTVKEVEDRIYRIFSDNAEGISFSTVHRAKGLEANRVFILKPDQFPHPMAQQDWEKKQEKNAAYVAITRHKQELIFVEGFFKF